MVPGEGPQPARGMIVGEAPGFKEEEVGRPFVGQSGRLLDNALRALGVDRTKMYVTNVVKVVPLRSDGKIRQPTGDEVASWIELLRQEILSTAPEAILALGKTASRALVGMAVGDDAAELPAGSKVENIYTAWHPSYILRQGGLFVTHDHGKKGEWLEQIRPWAEIVGEWQEPT